MRIIRGLLGQFNGVIKFEHTLDMKAKDELQVIVGEDNTTRINVDGVCVMRITMGEDCKLHINTPVELVVDG